VESRDAVPLQVRAKVPNMTDGSGREGLGSFVFSSGTLCFLGEVAAGTHPGCRSMRGVHVSSEVVVEVDMHVAGRFLFG